LLTIARKSSRSKLTFVANRVARDRGDFDVRDARSMPTDEINKNGGVCMTPPFVFDVACLVRG
jgi:hypothetical protein